MDNCRSPLSIARWCQETDRPAVRSDLLMDRSLFGPATPGDKIVLADLTIRRFAYLTPRSRAKATGVDPPGGSLTSAGLKLQNFKVLQHLERLTTDD